MKLIKEFLNILGRNSAAFWNFVNKHSLLSGITATVIGGLILLAFTNNSSNQTINDDAIYYDAGEVL